MVDSWIIKTRILMLMVLVLCGIEAIAQQSVALTLDRTIMMAADSSLEAFRSKNFYMARYWEYRTFKAGRLPSLTLNLTPGQYNRTFIKRYDSEADVDVYRQQQAYEAFGGLAVAQNFDLLGGRFFLNTNLDYLRNFGHNTYTQYTSVPVRIGYTQELLGYNDFKWQKKIEPLKYEKAKKQLVYELENISQLAVSYFFNLAKAQEEYNMAKEKVSSSDTLFHVAGERFKIAAIGESDYLSLKLERLNAVNSLENAEISLKRAMFALTSFLNLDKNTTIQLMLPSYPKSMEITPEKALVEARENNPALLEFKQNILESRRTVDRTRLESIFNASIWASIGFNQVAGTLSDAFRDPLRQDIVSLGVSIPLVDWGVRKGRYNMARNNLSVSEITAHQGEIKVEEDVLMTVNDFNIQRKLIASAVEAYELADDIYAKTHQRFLIGSGDINTLVRTYQSQLEARRNYISALERYWISYYKIRSLTLFDFEYNVPIINTIENKYLLIGD